MPTNVETAVTSNGTQPANGAPMSASDGEAMDKYGRLASERTVILEVDDAERVDHEVTAGGHQTFDDGLHYIIERGLAEIKRQRDSLAALKVQRSDAKAMSALRTAVANNPALMEDPVKLAEAFKTLGIKLSGK